MTVLPNRPEGRELPNADGPAVCISLSENAGSNASTTQKSQRSATRSSRRLTCGRIWRAADVRYPNKRAAWLDGRGSKRLGRDRARLQIVATGGKERGALCPAG